MSVFRDFELKALRLLLPPAHADLAERFSGSVKYEYTGVGYFLTVRDPTLPAERSVYDEPWVEGTSGPVQCHFVVFVERHELTLECYTIVDDMPEDFRDQVVRISTPPAYIGPRDAT